MEIPLLNVKETAGEKYIEIVMQGNSLTASLILFLVFSKLFYSFLDLKLVYLRLTKFEILTLGFIHFRVYFINSVPFLHNTITSCHIKSLFVVS